MLNKGPLLIEYVCMSLSMCVCLNVCFWAPRPSIPKNCTSLYTNTRLLLVMESRHLDVLMNFVQNSDWCQRPKQAIRRSTPGNMMYVPERIPFFWYDGLSLKAILWQLFICNSMATETKSRYTFSYFFVLVTAVTFTRCNDEDAAMERKVAKT